MIRKSGGAAPGGKLSINMRIIFLFLSALSGCAGVQQREVHVYSPTCPAGKLAEVNSMNAAIQYLECGNREKALRILKYGAENGDAEMASTFIAVLRPDNYMGEGLAYALKYAEQGDESAIYWSLRIVRLYKLKSLTVPVSEMWLGLFEKKVPYIKELLNDYLEYSAENIQYNGGVTITYSARFLEMTQYNLSKAEYDAALEKLNNIKASCRDC